MEGKQFLVFTDERYGRMDCMKKGGGRAPSYVRVTPVGASATTSDPQSQYSHSGQG